MEHWISWELFLKSYNLKSPFWKELCTLRLKSNKSRTCLTLLNLWIEKQLFFSPRPPPSPKLRGTAIHAQGVGYQSKDANTGNTSHLELLAGWGTRSFKPSSTYSPTLSDTGIVLEEDLFAQVYSINITKCYYIIQQSVFQSLPIPLSLTSFPVVFFH